MSMKISQEDMARTIGISLRSYQMKESGKNEFTFREMVCIALKLDISIFDLLKNIVSLGTKIHNDGIEFHPMFVMADGSRTFSIEDISEDDYLILHSLKLEKMPLILRALIADILWTNKKEFNAAKIAANAYWELFTLWYRDDDNVGTIDIIRRAVCISAQTKQTLLFEKIQGWFVDFLEKKAANNDGFFALRVMELFFGQKNFDVSIFLPVLDNMIAYNNDNIAKVEQAYMLKTECLFKLKKKEEATKNNLLFILDNISFCVFLQCYFFLFVSCFRKANIKQKKTK